MKQIFKVGDAVYDHTYEWGTVVDIDSNTVLVKFDSISGNHVLYWGVLLKKLSFTEYTLKGFSQERPEPLPNKGDIVWVRDFEEDYWEITHFLAYQAGQSLPYIVSETMTIRDSDTYKFLTTTNPYKNGK
jgi:hypothetical protein